MALEVDGQSARIYMGTTRNGFIFPIRFKSETLWHVLIHTSCYHPKTGTNIDKRKKATN